MTYVNRRNEPFVGTAIRVYDHQAKTWGNVEIADLSDEELLSEYAAEVDGDTRSISSDPPSPAPLLEAEILRRMAKKP